MGHELTTSDISIRVVPRYEASMSKPLQDTYVYSYTVTITNRGSHAMQLLHRYWTIMDATAQLRKVEGEGVIGQQPVIEPGESYTYSSWSPLATPVGKMYGQYCMRRLADGVELMVDIPSFKLIAPMMAN